MDADEIKAQHDAARAALDATPLYGEYAVARREAADAEGAAHIAWLARADSADALAGYHRAAIQADLSRRSAEALWSRINSTAECRAWHAAYLRMQALQVGAVFLDSPGCKTSCNPAQAR